MRKIVYTIGPEASIAIKLSDSLTNLRETFNVFNSLKTFSEKKLIQFRF